jgi:hypothetical protein
VSTTSRHTWVRSCSLTPWLCHGPFFGNAKRCKQI